MNAMTLVRGLAAARAVVGAALAIKTETMLRLMVRDAPPTGSLFAFARTVGVRDLAFGLGALSSTWSGDAREIRRWVAVWLASDVGDVIGGVSAHRQMGWGGAMIAAAVPAPFIAAGIWALRQLSGPAPRTIPA